MSYRPFSFGFRNRGSVPPHNGWLIIVVILVVFFLLFSLIGMRCDAKMKENYLEDLREESIREIEQERKAEEAKEKADEKTKPKIEAPYVGMDESLISSTDMGAPYYSHYVVGGTDYTFLLKDGYAWRVVTENGKVSMIQRFKDGKLLGSTTETGDHDPILK